MSGKLNLYDLRTGATISTRSDHQKYAVRVACSTPTFGQTDCYIATAAWDAKVHLYHVELGDPVLTAPIFTITLPTNPESILFIPHPELTDPILVLTRRDSTFLYYYSMPPPDASGSAVLLGRQNLAPHSNAWIAFTPSSIALHPTDSALVAIATSAMPSMKLLITRLLLPPPTGTPDLPTLSIVEPTTPVDASLGGGTQAAQARAALAQAEREDAAILLHVSTQAPQTQYSTPEVVWRPDGTGVWVNGDDGVLRGVEVTTGKVVRKLAGGHEAGSKVRCLWAGIVDEEELVVSGGFDRRLVVWR